MKNVMTIEEFRNNFGEIIYSGTLTENENFFVFKLANRDMLHNGTMFNQPYVQVLKEDAGKAREAQELFHEYCEFVAED